MRRRLGGSAPLLLAIALGALAGVGSYTFSYAKGLSYFSTDPRACVNCHIMQSEYDGWQKASHHTAAVCIDCHLPHDFVPKYLAGRLVLRLRNSNRRAASSSASRSRELA